MRLSPITNYSLKRVYGEAFHHWGSHKGILDSPCLLIIIIIIIIIIIFIYNWYNVVK